MNSSRVLGVFAKAPTPGQVKTRLAAETSTAFAAQVAAAFLRDLVERLASFPAQRWLAFAPSAAAPYFAELTDHFTLTPQGDGGLGQRMAHFFGERIQRGATQTVLIGTDSPTLPLSHIEQAFQALTTHDLVLGPATDGGYYLVGVGRRLPPIFHDIAWGSNRVLAETVARLDEDWKLALLPPWYDVDVLADWQLLCDHMMAMRKADHDPQLPHTCELAYPAD